MVASLEDRINKGKKGNNKSGKGSLAKIPSGPRGGISKHKTDRKGSNSGPSNIDGKWKHDLFASSKSTNTGGKKKPGEGPSLESRISKVPTKISTSVAKSLASNKLFAALHGGALTALEREKAAKEADSIGASIRGISSKDTKKPQHQHQHQQKFGHGFSIRGSAGPFAVHASNFAPATTASDIRAAMEGIGNIVACAVTSASPTVIAEIVFEKKEDADTCIQMYNNKKADGYLLHMFLKNSPSIHIPKGGASNTPKTQNQQPSNRDRPRGGGGRGDVYTPPARQDANKNLVDGTRGFQPPKLYSDAIVQKGRGFNR